MPSNDTGTGTDTGIGADTGTDGNEATAPGLDPATPEPPERPPRATAGWSTTPLEIC